MGKFAIPLMTTNDQRYVDALESLQLAEHIRLIDITAISANMAVHRLPATTLYRIFKVTESGKLLCDQLQARITTTATISPGE